MTLQLTPEAIYMQFSVLLNEMPDFAGSADGIAEKQKWLGRAIALAQATGDNHDALDAIDIKLAAGHVGLDKICASLRLKKLHRLSSSYSPGLNSEHQRRHKAPSSMAATSMTHSH